MATPVIMPKIEMAQEKATVIEWLKQEGDEVEKGEAVLEVETDKVTMEVEAPAAGILAGLRGEPGDKIPVTETIAYVLEAGEPLPEEPSAEEEAQTDQERATAPKASTDADEEYDATPVARRVAEAEGVDLSTVKGTGRDGRITKSDVEAAAKELEGEAVEDAAGRVRATPAARRVAGEEQVDLAEISGSGPKGRVQADDVRAFAAKREEVPAPSGRVVPLEGMRATIAKRMTRSYQDAPHITFTVEVDMGPFEEARAQLNERAEATDQPHVTVTALLVKAVAWTLQNNPWLNSTLREGEIHFLPHINVGVAVALDEGLIVPVVHHADQKGVAELAADVRELTSRARENRLRPSDVSEGTFTISNLGPFGIEAFKAIINPPEVGILAVGTVRQRFVPDEDGNPVARPLMKMTLSADHRVVDGATAAGFLKDLRRALESPTLLLW